MSKLHTLKNAFRKKQKSTHTKPSTIYSLFVDDMAAIDHLDASQKLDFERLFQSLPLIFPDEASTACTIRELQKEKALSFERETINYKFLKSSFVALHLFNQQWMVNHIDGIVNQGKKYVSEATIKQFIGMPTFQEARQEYLQKYFRAKIKDFMSKPFVENREERLQEPFTCKGFVDFKDRINCDKYFREHLRCCFTLEGFDYRIIEREIERNADLWRPQVMKKSIDNYYQMHMKYLTKSELNSSFEKSFKESCLVYREYKYYQKHKNVIDELAIATPNMKITPSQARLIKNKISQISSFILYDTVKSKS